jgi:hypothetical protein
VIYFAAHNLSFLLLITWMIKIEAFSWSPGGDELHPGLGTLGSGGEVAGAKQAGDIGAKQCGGGVVGGPALPVVVEEAAEKGKGEQT